MSSSLAQSGSGDGDIDNENAARKAYQYIARNTTLQQRLEVFINELAWLQPTDDYAFLIDRLTRHSQPAILKSVTFFEAFDSYGFPCVGICIDGDKGNSKSVTFGNCLIINTMFDMSAVGHVSRMIPEMQQFSRRFVRYAKLFLSTLQEQYLEPKSFRNQSLAQPSAMTTTKISGCPLSTSQVQFDTALEICAEELLKLNPPVQATPVPDERPTTANVSKPTDGKGGKSEKKQDKTATGKNGAAAKRDKNSFVGPSPAQVVIPNMPHVMSRFDGLNFPLSLLRLLVVARDNMSSSSTSLHKALSDIVNNSAQQQKSTRTVNDREQQQFGTTDVPASTEPKTTAGLEINKSNSPASSIGNTEEHQNVINLCFSCMRFGLGNTKMPFIREVFLTVGDPKLINQSQPSPSPTFPISGDLAEPVTSQPPLQEKLAEACYISTTTELRTFLSRLPQIYMQTCDRFERATAAATAGAGKSAASAAAAVLHSSAYHVLANLLIPPPATDKIEGILDPLLEAIALVQNYPNATTSASASDQISKEAESFAAPRPTIAVPVVPPQDLAEISKIDHGPPVDINIWFNAEQDSSHRAETGTGDAVKHKYEWLASGGNAGWKTTDELIAIYTEILNKYPRIRLLVDPLHHTDCAGYEKLRKNIHQNSDHFVALSSTRTVALYESAAAARATSAAATTVAGNEAKDADAKVAPTKSATVANISEMSPGTEISVDGGSVTKIPALVDIGAIKIDPHLTITQLIHHVDEAAAVLAPEDKYCLLMASDCFLSSMDVNLYELAVALSRKRVRWLWLRSICSRAEYTDTLNKLLLLDGKENV